MTVNHEGRAHARLSPSSAKRWINCPPSVALSEKYGKPKETDYAKEGTLAHSIGELMIRYNNGELTKPSTTLS